MDFCNLEKELDHLITSLKNKNLLTLEMLTSTNFLHEINQSNFLITLHDIELHKPICLNNKMAAFYGYDKNWLQGLDYIHYLKTIHSSTYNNLLESIDIFKKEKKDFLNLKYKLLYKKEEWKSVIGTTKIILTKKNIPKYTITLATEKQSAFLNKLKNLTKREKQITSFLCNGLSRKEIADLLFISENTVNTHSRNIYKKININKVTDLMILKEQYSF